MGARDVITRELRADDRDAVLELLVTAQSGCAFPVRAGAALWRRWQASTILGTFDDAGSLYSVRVLERIGARRARLRAGCHREPLDAAAGYAEPMKRSLRGYVAWLRQVGIDAVEVPLQAGMLEAWGPVRPHLAGVLAGDTFECQTDDLAAFAGGQP